MKNNTFQIRVLIFALAISVIGFVLGWWSILLIAVGIGWFETSLKNSMKLAFVSCFVSWLALTLVFDAINGFRISMRIGGMVSVPFPIFANLIAAVIGGVLVALAAATANQARAAFLRKQS